MLPDLPATPAPALEVECWVGARPGPTLAALRGSVVALHFFQRGCRACTEHGLPQAVRLHARFAGRGFESLAVCSPFDGRGDDEPAALAAFAASWRLPFAVALDARADAGALPRTLQAWDVAATPAVALIDRAGRVRAKCAGLVEDEVLARSIETLLAEPPPDGPERPGDQSPV